MISPMPRNITILRPITVPLLAAALGVKPFQLMAHLVRMGRFLPPFAVLEDALAIQLAAAHDVDLRFPDDGKEGLRFPN